MAFSSFENKCKINYFRPSADCCSLNDNNFLNGKQKACFSKEAVLKAGNLS